MIGLVCRGTLTRNNLGAYICPQAVGTLTDVYGRSLDLEALLKQPGRDKVPYIAACDFILAIQLQSELALDRDEMRTGGDELLFGSEFGLKSGPACLCYERACQRRSVHDSKPPDVLPVLGKLRG